MNGPLPNERSGRAPPGEPRGQDVLGRFETTPHGVITVNDEGVITAIDPFAQALFGVAEEEVLGQAIANLLPALADGIPAPEPGHPPVIRHFEGVCRDGSAIGVEVALARNGQPDKLLVAVREVAPATLREEHARRAATMALLGRFSSRICHDLKNHLMAVSGYSELAAGRIEKDPEKARQMVEQVLEAADRALAYVEGIHALGRGRPDGVRTLGLGPVLEEMEPRLRSKLPEVVTLHLDLSEAEGAAEVVTEGLERALGVLLENAAEAMPDGGRIDIRVGTAEVAAADALPDLAPGRYATIDIVDEGAGLDAATRSRLFEPFLKPPKERGRGIGLASVYALCRQLGGGVKLESRLGEGTTIRLHLPYRKSTPAAWPAESMPEAMGNTKPAGGTILVVDDVPSVRNIAKEALEDFGYRVLVAENGHVALEMASSHPERIDLLLTDVLMPGMNGRELAQAFGEQYPRIPILFMSAYAREPLPAGASGRTVPFIAKPFTPRDLATKVRTVLSGAA